MHPLSNSYVYTPIRGLSSSNLFFEFVFHVSVTRVSYSQRQCFTSALRLVEIVNEVEQFNDRR